MLGREAAEAVHVDEVLVEVWRFAFPHSFFNRGRSRTESCLQDLFFGSKKQLSIFMFLSHPAPSKRKKRGPLLHPLEKAIGWSADISVFDFKLDCLGLCSERRKSVKQASEAMRGGQAWLGDDMDQSCNRMPQDATDRMPQTGCHRMQQSLPLSLSLSLSWTWVCYWFLWHDGKSELR